MAAAKKIGYIIISLALVFVLLLCYITNNESNLISVNSAAMLPQFLIDAGHGGEDGGAVAADGTLEKDINLQIADQLHVLCVLFGIDSIMIRASEDDLADHSLPTVRKRKMSDINARMKILNEYPQAVYVGIHQNQYSDKTVQGLQVFYSDNHAVSRALANAIQQQTRNILQPENSRAVKSAGDSIYILHHAKQPAIMVECGFLSNEEECRKLKDVYYGTQLSLCIIGGIIEYYNSEGIT